MIMFNWGALRRVTKDKPFLIFQYFSQILDKEKYMSPIYKAALLSKHKHSFIRNPEPIVRSTNRSDVMERLVYLDLAAARSFGNYMEYGTLYLPMELVNYDISALQNNRHITVKPDRIELNYED